MGVPPGVPSTHLHGEKMKLDEVEQFITSTCSNSSHSYVGILICRMCAHDQHSCSMLRPRFQNVIVNQLQRGNDPGQDQVILTGVLH